MKNCILGLLAAAALLAGGNAQAAQVSTFDDIQLWAGSGANRSALVIDFHYGGSDASSIESFVWGYRWDGSATGEDMLTDIAAFDSALQVPSASFVQMLSYNYLGNNYSRTSDFIEDISWGYYLAGGQAGISDDSWTIIGHVDITGGGSGFPASWTASPSGAADRLLADGSWDAWSFGSYDPNTFVHLAPPGSEAFAAVPEPGSVLLLLAGLGLLCFKRQRRFRS